MNPLRIVHEALGALGFCLFFVCLVGLMHGFGPDIEQWIWSFR